MIHSNQASLRSYKQTIFRLSVLPSSPNPSEMTFYAFDTLKSLFKGDLITRDDADYEKAIARWARNATRRAKIVAFAKDAEDVSLAVKFASAEKLPIAVRGGGHSASGTSSTEDGLVVDLSRYLNRVRIDSDERRAYVDGGAIWQTVDEAAIAQGLATVGGTVNHVSHT